MYFLDKRIDFPENLFNNQVVIVKRSIAYLYKVFIYSALLLLILFNLVYIHLSYDFASFIYLFFIIFIIISWYYFMIKYLLNFKKNFKTYYFYS